MARVLFAAETLVSANGGADRFALESLADLAEREHEVRALYLSAPGGGDGGGPVHEPPVALAREAGVELRGVPTPATDSVWPSRLARTEAVGAAVTSEIARRQPDVVLTQQTAGGEVVAAARAAGISSLVNVLGYEAVCHWRIQLDNNCRPETRCRGCPRTLALPPVERAARIRVADRHAQSLRDADALVAPSAAIAGVVHGSCGRRPEVIPCVGPLPLPVDADPAGPVLAVSSLWTREKGGRLLAPIARAIAPRTLIVQAGDGGRLAPIPGDLADQPNVALRLEPCDAVSLFPGAALLLVPSQLPDPFPRLAVEGMAAGLPVLASATGGLVESVPEPQLVDSHDDPDAWAAAIARVLRPRQWKEARRAGIAAADTIVASRPLDRFAAIVERLSAGTDGRPGQPTDSGSGA
ncbi:MAG: glycosyltransferase [Solirubrobacterales bacterium]